MKSIWTPGSVKWHRPPKRSHELITWTLWAVVVALLCLWLLGLSTGYTLGGKIHLLAVGAVLIGALCTYLVFKYEEFLEPLAKRSRKKTPRS